MIRISPQRYQAGGIVLLVLFMLLVFVIISAASMRIIARQANQTTLQEQEEQAFEIADAGVNYVLWLLSTTGGNLTPPQLLAAPPASATNHPVTDRNNQVIGKFNLFFGPACSDALTFRAVGYDQIKTNLCQVIDAKVQRFVSGEYKLVKWDHLVSYPCDQNYVPPSPAVCTP